MVDKGKVNTLFFFCRKWCKYGGKPEKMVKVVRNHITSLSGFICLSSLYLSYVNFVQ